MELERFTQELEALEKALSHFVDPTNHDGFLRHFSLWVVQQWSYRNTFAQTVENASFHCDRYRGNLHPHPTRPPIYKDFISACNARVAAQQCPLSGKAVQDNDDALYPIYGEACASEVARFIERRGLTLPASLGEATVEHFVWGLMADPDCHPELFAICERIVAHYGQAGTGIEPYLSEVGCPKDEAAWEGQRFAHWTLEDFQKVAAVEWVESALLPQKAVTALT